LTTEPRRARRSLPKRTVRLCALATALAIFALAWLTINARPWQAEAKAAPDPRVAALEGRERLLQLKATDVRHVVYERFASYRERLEARKKAIAAAERRHRRELKRAKRAAAIAARTPRYVTATVPVVRTVALAPVTKTKSS